MVWNSLEDFLHMGGYALYVWGSVLVTVGFMLVEQLILALRKKTILEYLGRVRQFDDEEFDDESPK